MESLKKYLKQDDYTIMFNCDQKYKKYLQKIDSSSTASERIEVYEKLIKNLNKWIAAAESAQRHLNSRSDLQPNVKVEHMQQLSNGLQQRRTCLTTCQKNKKIEEANQRTSQGHSQNNNSQNAVVRYQPQPQQQQQQQLVQSSQLQAGYQQHQGQVQYRHQQLASAQQHHQVTGYRITQTNTAQIYGPNNQVIGGYSVQSTAFGAGAMPQIR